MSNILQLVGERIRALRIERGLSQEQLALKAELNTSFIGQIERGIKSPTITSLEKLVNALDIKFEDFFSFEAPSTIKDTSVIERIGFQLSGRNIEEQEDIYQFVKQLLVWRDKR